MAIFVLTTTTTTTRPITLPPCACARGNYCSHCRSITFHMSYHCMSLFFSAFAHSNVLHHSPSSYWPRLSPTLLSVFWTRLSSSRLPDRESSPLPWWTLPLYAHQAPNFLHHQLDPLSPASSNFAAATKWGTYVLYYCVSTDAHTVSDWWLICS